MPPANNNGLRMMYQIPQATIAAKAMTPITIPAIAPLLKLDALLLLLVDAGLGVGETVVVGKRVGAVVGEDGTVVGGPALQLLTHPEPPGAHAVDTSVPDWQ